MVIPSSPHQLFLLHLFYDKVTRAQVDEIRRKHAEACAKLLLEEERQKRAKKSSYAWSHSSSFADDELTLSFFG